MSAIRPAGRPRRPRRKLQTPNPEVRERIMTAAADLILERGFPDLHIEEIVEGAGLSVGTFYLYFDSKADLFVALATDYTERLRSRMSAAYQSEGSPLQRVRRGLDVYLDFVEEYKEGFVYFLRAADGMMTSAGRLSAWTFEVHAKNLQPLLEEAIRVGEMKPLNPELTAQALVGLTQHMVTYWLDNQDRYSREELRAFLTAATAVALAP